MNYTLPRFLASFAILTATTAVAADNTSDNNVTVPDRAIVLTGGQNGVNSQVMTVLYDTSNLHFQDPEPPRFLLIDREGKTIFGIGGYVEGVGMYDFDGAIDNSGFVTRDINVPTRPDMRNRLGADFSHSNIFMQLVTNTRFGVLSAYVKGNFSGVGYGFKLKQAYVKLHNVTGGLTRSTFQDVICGVPTIDYQGPSGAVSAKNILIRYDKTFARNFSFGISAEMPSANYSTGNKNKAISQRVPDIPGYIQYAWDGGKSHVRLSGMVRNLSYRNLMTGENRFATGWGAQLSGAVRCTPVATFYYQAAYGKGYEHYLNDLAGAGFDLITNGDDGSMRAPAALGVVGGIRLNITKKLFVSSSYSLCRLYDLSTLGPDTYRRANYVVANCFYSPIPDMQLGVEYLHGERTNMDHSSATANRVVAMLKYSF